MSRCMLRIDVLGKNDQVGQQQQHGNDDGGDDEPGIQCRHRSAREKRCKFAGAPRVGPPSSSTLVPAHVPRGVSARLRNDAYV